MQKAEGKRPLGIPNRKLQDGTDCMCLAQNMDNLQFEQIMKLWV